MALETLKNVVEINGFDVVVMDELREKYPEKFNKSGAMDWKWFEADIRPKHFIYLRHDKNSISFTIQDGPVKEKGVNGCQVDTLITAARIMIQGLQEKLPCDENVSAIEGLEIALRFLRMRRARREQRGVEGTSAP